MMGAKLLPLLQCGTILLFLPPAILMTTSYFLALRPRKGTTEWIRRLDAPKFVPIAAQPLHMTDLLWCIWSAVCAVPVSVLFLFFRTERLFSGQIAQIWTQSSQYLPLMGLSAALACATYLLLRSWYPHNKVGLWGAALTPLIFQDQGLPAVLLVLSVCFFWLWMNTDPQAIWLHRAAFQILFTVCYGAALVLCMPAVFLAPLFLAGYIRTLVYRWRNSAPQGRAGRLLLTLLLPIPAIFLTVLCGWALYGFLSGTVQDLNTLRSLQYYAQLLPLLTARLNALLVFPNLRDIVTYDRIYLTLLGLGALFPVLHGLIRRRDERCLYILLLLCALIGMWLICGEYLLGIGLLPAFGWVWETCTSRSRGRPLRIPKLFLAAFLLTEIIFIILGRIVL